MSINRKLSIQVERSISQMEKLRDFKWQNSLSTLVDSELSHRVFSDEKVITVLQLAFENKLNRNNAWCLDQIASEDRSSYIKAAQVFKRGVTVVPDDKFEFKQSKHNEVQNYSVEIVNSSFDCFSQFNPDDLIIVDSNVSKFWWHVIPAEYEIVEFSELHKNLIAVGEILDLIKARIAKHHGIKFKVFVVGGGVACDVAGFACGLVGCETVFVPTTLLSIVDSSIGGKVGVNFEPWGKNQIGLFYPPIAVRVWPGWLKTLDPDEIKSGIAEAIKHAIISGNKNLFIELIRLSKTNQISDLSQLIIEILSVKAEVVNRDPYEHGERAILNFGHTLGHVLESLAAEKHIKITHGACVAIGMIHALRVSQKMFGSNLDNIIKDIIDSGIVAQRSSLIRIFGGCDYLQARKSAIMALLAGDKKSSDTATISFVLLQDFGVVARNKDDSWTVRIDSDEAWSDLLITWKFLTEF